MMSWSSFKNGTGEFLRITIYCPTCYTDPPKELARDISCTRAKKRRLGFFNHLILELYPYGAVDLCKLFDRVNDFLFLLLGVVI